jgi:hypothetical protein
MGFDRLGKRLKEVWDQTKLAGWGAFAAAGLLLALLGILAVGYLLILSYLGKQ